MTLLYAQIQDEPTPHKVFPNWEDVTTLDHETYKNKLLPIVSLDLAEIDPGLSGMMHVFYHEDVAGDSFDVEAENEKVIGGRILGKDSLGALPDFAEPVDVMRPYLKTGYLKIHRVEVPDIEQPPEIADDPEGYRVWLDTFREIRDAHRPDRNAPYFGPFPSPVQNGFMGSTEGFLGQLYTSYFGLADFTYSLYPGGHGWTQLMQMT